MLTRVMMATVTVTRLMIMLTMTILIRSAAPTKDATTLANGDTKSAPNTDERETTTSLSNHSAVTPTDAPTNPKRILSVGNTADGPTDRYYYAPTMDALLVALESRAFAKSTGQRSRC